MRRHREEFSFAVREGISLPEARRRLHAQRMAEIEAQRLRRYGAPAPVAEEVGRAIEQPTLWYQRDDL
jgi:hypothetical protein